MVGSRKAYYIALYRLPKRPSRAKTQLPCPLMTLGPYSTHFLHLVCLTYLAGKHQLFRNLSPSHIAPSRPLQLDLEKVRFQVSGLYVQRLSCDSRSCC